MTSTFMRGNTAKEMAIPEQPPGVRLVLGVLVSDAALLPEVKRRTAGLFGEPDMQSEVFAFDFTDYYENEMGKHIKRQFFSFPRLIESASLPDIKLQTNALEEEIACLRGVEAPRPVNLDPGYIEAGKLVLATTKDYAHRIHLGRGIYGEVTLLFREGAFEALPWTYPDYRTAAYRDFFARARQKYLEQLKAAAHRRNREAT